MFSPRQERAGRGDGRQKGRAVDARGVADDLNRLVVSRASEQKLKLDRARIPVITMKKIFESLPEEDANSLFRADATTPQL